ncbi:hypothetical protein GUJ93_ZPchr0010g10243 [Zizania palustris]|uniref:Uncharacterized protein n=1 Tax=Zizania palustris TaxID=103762 RepID=A0A8J5WA30_ZIZPA|nr:hypothetical protein GUJ93_ZPchr0010g10243 [Zizania palustris]
MSCFGMVSTGMDMSPSPSRRRGVVGTWRWWRRCAGLAAVIHSKIRRRAVRWGVHGGRGRGRGRRRSSSSLQSGWCHHRSSAPVYVDELYSRPKTHHVAVHEAPPPQQPSSKLAAPAGTSNNAATANKAAAAAATATNAGARSVLMSPRRGVAARMGEVDLRAELFISKFREEMRLQSQQSAEEFHAMLARGL